MMKSDKFLEQVAEYYTSSSRCGDMANLVFVMPNKRSAMFLKRYIQQRVVGDAVFMPKFLTFGRLVAIESQLAEAGQNDKLFMLYKAYRRVLEKHGHPDQARDFDKFVFWGDMILNDFDLIDQSLASPEKLYKNLKNIKELTADYLTEEQKEVIKKFWGETPMTGHVNSFWIHTEGESSATVQKFVSLWQILADIYDEFRNDLESRKMATSGMQMKIAVKKFKDMSVEKLRRRCYVFVGHADLSLAELSIMERLKDVGCADFFWDVASPLFQNDEDGLSVENKALRIIKRLSRQFPMPHDFELKQVHNEGIIDIYGVSSNVGQAKMAASVIAQMSDECRLLPEEAINTAIILPDTSLLMPLMLGMPDPEKTDGLSGRLAGVNVTMSLPFTSTTIATLFRVIILMQMHARKRRGRWTFFYQDILEVLAHPHIQLIEPEQSEIIRRKIRKDKLYNVDAVDLANEFPKVSYIFKPVADPMDLQEVYDYMIGLLAGLRTALRSKFAIADMQDSLEIQIIEYFEQSVVELYELVKSYDITMSESTFFMMFDRILASKKMSLTGSPLQGVQIMGVLETRALDFDNIIFLSMNERTFPRKNYVKTMIPNNLRYGYGLPSIEISESYYSYYFYRAISRAKHVRLFYDSRSESGGGGEMSRYLTQLIYSDLSQKINHNTVSTNSDLPNSRTIVVEKTQAVLDALDEFKHLGKKRISASALKAYMQCPLSFYLQYVKGLRDEDEPAEYLKPSVLGNIFHATARWLYEPYKGQVITAEMLDEMINGPRLKEILRREMSKQGYNSDTPIPDEEMTAEAVMNMFMIEKQLQYMFDVEKQTYLANGSFMYVNGEEDVVDMLWQITPELKINFRMQIDRIDQIADGHLRFIDYKTGLDECSVNSIDMLFAGNSKKTAIFQLLLYAEAYNDLVCPGVSVVPVIHQLRDIARDHKIEPLTLGRSKTPIRYPEVSAEFRPRLNELVTKIFDDSTPFAQCENVKQCEYCKFVNMCGRNLPEKQ